MSVVTSYGDEAPALPFSRSDFPNRQQYRRAILDEYTRLTRELNQLKEQDRWAKRSHKERHKHVWFRHKVMKMHGISRHHFGSLPNPLIDLDEKRRQKRRVERESRKVNRNG